MTALRLPATIQLTRITHLRIRLYVAGYWWQINKLSRMWQPAHLDGRRVVVIRAGKSFLGGYEVIEAGMLEHDGKVLYLVGDHGSRVVTDAELESLQPVVQPNRISACRGFDFFLLWPASAG